MENRKKNRLTALLVISGLCAWAQPASAAKAERMRYVMGTLLQIEVEAPDPTAALRAVEAAFKETEKWEGLLSNYRADSEISRINREAFPHGAATRPEILDFLSDCRRFSEATDGWFDVTVEPLTRLWKLRAREMQKMPADVEIENAKSKVNFKNLRLAASAKTATFLTEGMGIDTGGIGKGYALDKALQEIRKHPVQSAALNFGGEILYWSQEPRKRTFTVRNPERAKAEWETLFFTVYSTRTAISTSGNYERFVTLREPKKILGHILNPKTGKPADNGIRSVTVLAQSAAEADAFSTALFAMGLENAKAYSDRLAGAGLFALYETRDGRLENYRSKNWSEWTEE